MSEERYAEHTVAWEMSNGDSVTKGNYNLAGIETKYIPIQTEIVSDDKDQTINELQQRIAELEDKWNKLREWAKNSTEVLLYSIGDKPAKLGNKKYNYFERKQLLDKMQELENGENK